MALARRRFIVSAAIAIALSIGVYVATSRTASPSKFNLFKLFGPQPMQVKLRRTCVACPNYAITLMGDGTLIYEGGDLALVPGMRKMYVDAMTASAIFDHFVNSEFLELSHLNV